MIGYLSLINASNCVDVLREELQLQDCFPDESIKKYERILESKWTCIANLKIQVKLSRQQHGVYTDLGSSDRETGGRKSPSGV